ncbi:hypothetical protein DPMN_092119 [Dreissena polymorpha]|uniref:Uncharacterized protein n=1 Tax=Dreissena polymorpha TaxID=45954 RepID=A0A9D4L3B7_DREPO|nr:hypothetical protein DPMN_092119 [Dreissena polymorpha]
MAHCVVCRAHCVVCPEQCADVPGTRRSVPSKKYMKPGFSLTEKKENLEHDRSLIRNYYSNINLRFAFQIFTTSWISLEKGIVTGGSISVILFVMGNRNTRATYQCRFPSTC